MNREERERTKKTHTHTHTHTHILQVDNEVKLLATDHKMTFLSYYYKPNNKSNSNYAATHHERQSPLHFVGDKRFLWIALLASTLSLLWLQYSAPCTFFDAATATNQIILDRPTRIADGAVPMTTTKTTTMDTSVQRRTVNNKNNIHELTDAYPVLTFASTNNKNNTVPAQTKRKRPLPYQENNKFPRGVSRLVVLVQGPLNNLDTWCDRIHEQGEGDVLLIYGVFDQKPPAWFNAYHRDKCQVIYIPKTTWTQGRNALSKAAYCYEQMRQKDFMYWIFSDDDIVFWKVCNKNNCWRRYFAWIKDNLPKIKTPLLVGSFAPPLVPFALTDYYDAALNAMDRKQIHLVLPYITKEPKGTSWWLSALVQIQVGRACYPMAAMAYTIAIRNPVHRKYPRGLSWDDGAALVVNNYHDYVPRIPVPSGNETRDIRHIQLLDRERLIQYVAEQMEKAGDTCEPLKQRWQDWLTSWDSTNCTRFEISNVTMEEEEEEEEEEEAEEEAEDEEEDAEDAEDEEEDEEAEEDSEEEEEEDDEAEEEAEAEAAQE
jgi:hypothetical protein